MAATRNNILICAAILIALVLLSIPFADLIGQRLDSDKAQEGGYLTISARLYSENRFWESIGMASRALHINPGSTGARINLGSAYLKLGLWSEAEQDFETALRLEPENEPARNNLAWLRRERDKAASSRPAAAESLKRFWEHYFAGRYAEALPFAKQAVELTPDSVESWTALSMAHVRTSQFEEAIQAAALALRLNPNHDPARNALGWAMREMKVGQAARPVRPK